MMEESGHTNSQVLHANVYIKPVLPGWDEDKLLQLFSAFGEVDSVRLSTSPAATVPGARASHAFIRYRDIPSAVAAIQALNGFILEGQALMVKSADSDVVPRVQGGQVPSEWCYCRGIPATYSLQDICSLFLCYGVIVDIKQ
jgi:RNA recognition motif-containing protein